jgi:hypothetical protein
MRLKMSSDKRYEPQMSFDYTKWVYDWKSFASESTKIDGPDSVAISNYLFNVVGVDKRNIATGGASDYEFVIHYPRPNLADSYGQSQWMPILLIQALMDISPKRRILALSGGLDRFRLKPFQEIYNSEIYFLNNKKLALYEKFQYENAPMEYGAVTQQYLEGNLDFTFDMIVGWSQDMENPFIPVDFYLDRLEKGGILIIQNSSDSVFLYQNDTQASPVWEYHQDIKSRDDCHMYHIPLFYGITIVVKQ